MNLCKTNWLGWGKWRVVAAQFNRFGRLFNRMRGENGVEIRAEGDEIIISGAGAGGGKAFSGVAYIAGHRVSGLRSDITKLWVKCNLYDCTASEETGPAPNPFPAGEEWYEKAQVSGDIHIPRAG